MAICISSLNFSLIMTIRKWGRCTIKWGSNIFSLWYKWRTDSFLLSFFKIYEWVPKRGHVTKRRGLFHSIQFSYIYIKNIRKRCHGNIKRGFGNWQFVFLPLLTYLLIYKENKKGGHFTIKRGLIILPLGHEWSTFSKPILDCRKKSIGY